MSNKNETDILIQKYYDGILDDDEIVAFMAFLDENKDNNAVLDDITDQAKVHYLLSSAACSGQNGPLQTKKHDVQYARRHYSKSFLAGIAVCICVLLASVSIFLNQQRFYFSSPIEVQLDISQTKPSVQSFPNGEIATSAVAFLKTVSNVVWSKDSILTGSSGDLLSAGWMMLDEGIVSIQFFSGASIVVEGPAKLELISPMKVYCSKGRITTEVPKQAVGFQVDVPQMDIVDLGTSFTIEVSDNKSVVHVIDGEVELHRLLKEKLALKKGENAEVDDYGILKRNPDYKAEYVTSSEVEAGRTIEERKRYLQWQEQGLRLNTDPSLLARFDFEKENISGGFVLNMADSGKDSIRDGLLVGCEYTNGMWKGKGAIQFKRIADRFRFDIPGEFSAVTFASWVRVDSLERLYNSLFTTDGFSPGEIHWHILSNGKIELGINYDQDKPGFQLWSETAITPETLGKWIHLSTVVDNVNQEVFLYIDGVNIGYAKLTMNIPIRFKNGQLGNWTTDPTWDTPVHPIRFFCGAIGEFSVFSRALSQDEIVQLYQGTYRSKNDSSSRKI